MTHPKLMAAACELLRDARPDVLLLGGDFVSMRAAHVEEIAPRLADIPAPLGRFAVLGNHDHAADARHVAARLEAVGIQMLTNRNAQLPAPFAHVWICGLDDTGCGDPDAERTLRGADGVRIVLMHGPDGLLVLENRRFDVAFCGHTHGGQIAVPPRNPLHLGKGVLNRAYWRGRFQVGAEGRSTLMVSRGLGCTGLPVRLFATPEVILCTLRWEALKTG
jgi:predicted MPP superfamily phosphohydrolase